MKTKFTINYIMTHRGCYTKWQIVLLFLSNLKINYTLKDIIQSRIPNNDKFWFLWNCCDFSYSRREECYNSSIRTKEIMERIFGAGPGWVYDDYDYWRSNTHGSASEQNAILNDILEYSKKFE